jgi:hypothetical protein
LVGWLHYNTPGSSKVFSCARERNAWSALDFSWYVIRWKSLFARWKVRPIAKNTEGTPISRRVKFPRASKRVSFSPAMLLESKLERLAFWGHLRGGLGTLMGCYGTEIGPTPRNFTWFYGIFFLRGPSTTPFGSPAERVPGPQFQLGCLGSPPS